MCLRECWLRRVLDLKSTPSIRQAILERRGQAGILGTLDNNLDISDEEDDGDVADLLEQLKI